MPTLLISRRILRPAGGDECGAGARVMQSPSAPLKMPRPEGREFHLTGDKEIVVRVEKTWEGKKSMGLLVSTRKKLNKAYLFGPPGKDPALSLIARYS